MGTTRKVSMLVMVIAFVAYGVVQMGYAGRIRPARAIPGTYDSRGFRFMGVDASTGEPVRYDPCTPIRYVINPADAPEDGIKDVHTAFEEMSEASGLEFVFEGETDEVWVDNREAYQPERYGERWAPLLVSWTPDLSSTTSGAETTAVGRGGSTYKTNDEGEPVFVTGAAVFNASADLPPGFGGETWGQAMLHEFGHVVGLDHVDDEGSVMNPVIGLRAAAYGPGDRAGLWELGLGGLCLKAPPLP